MPDTDPFRKYIDAGMLFTQLTRQRAEEIVRELIKNGELNRDQAARWVEELLERSRQSTELLLGVVRKELDERITQLNLVTRDDLANLASRLTGAATRRERPAAKKATPASEPSTTGAATTSGAPGAAKRPRAAGAAKAAGAAGAAKSGAAANAAGATKAGPAAKAGGATKAAATKAPTSKATGAAKTPAASKTPAAKTAGADKSAAAKKAAKPTDPSTRARKA